MMKHFFFCSWNYFFSFSFAFSDFNLITRSVENAVRSKPKHKTAPPLSLANDTNDITSVKKICSWYCCMYIFLLMNKRKNSLRMYEIMSIQTIFDNNRLFRMNINDIIPLTFKCSNATDKFNGCVYGFVNALYCCFISLFRLNHFFISFKTPLLLLLDTDQRKLIITS